MTRDQVKAAADALGRLEALEQALKCATVAPQDALPISFVYVPLTVDESDGEVLGRGDGLASYTGIQAFYPRVQYIATIERLMETEESVLARMGVTV